MKWERCERRLVSWSWCEMEFETMRVRHGARWALLGLVAMCGTGVQAEALIPPSAPPDLALVFTGDVIGFIDPCG